MPWVPVNTSVRQATVAQQEKFLQQCRGGGGGSNSSGVAAPPPSFNRVFSDAPTPASIATGGGIAGLAASMIPEGVRITSSVDVGMGSRDGDMTSFVSASFTSGVDSLTLDASSSVGESGHKVGLESAYSGSGDNTSVLGSIHALTTASIMQLTDRRTDRLSIAPLALGGLVVGRVAIPHVVRWSRTIVNAYLLAEQVREQAEEAAKKVADESTSAATGGDGEDPGSDDEVDLKNRAAHERDKAQYRRDMERPHAEDPELRGMLEKFHRPEAKVGSGSTAASLRHELTTGELVGGVSHIQKTENSIRALTKWLDKNPLARPGDRAAAENMLRDLLDAAKGLL
jgi:hypothetical protein